MRNRAAARPFRLYPHLHPPIRTWPPWTAAGMTAGVRVQAASDRGKYRQSRLYLLTMSGVSLLEENRKFQTRRSSKPSGNMYSSKFHTTTTKS